MEINCPACGKTNDLRSAGACSRCACDLSQLGCVIDSAVWHLKAAAGQLRRGEWEQSLENARRSWSLHHSPRSAQLACVAAIALGNSEEALWWRAQAKQ